MDSWFVCRDGCTALRVNYSDDIYDDEDIDEVYFSIYSYGTAKETNSLLYKLRLIWRLLAKGSPYEDEIILSIDDVKRLGKLCERIQKKSKFYIESEGK